MKSINIEKLKNIKEDLDELDDDIISIEENGETKYIIMSNETFESFEEFQELMNDFQSNRPIVKFVGTNDNFELSYDEYESVKKQINDVLEKTFKPKPEKLS